MPNRRYRSGVNLEREIRQILEERYNIPCLRTAGSKSDFDLVALGRCTILIQVKYTSKDNIFPPLKLLERLKPYVTDNRWAVVVVVQRQTRRTFLGCIDTRTNPYDYDKWVAKFYDAMYKLYQLCSGYEVDNP